MHTQAQAEPQRASASGMSEQTVPPSTVRDWITRGECVLVDVREADEHARERIAGAELNALSSFEPSRIRAGGRVVLHCKSGKRSADALTRTGSLQASGIEFYSMQGGIEAWKAAGLPTQTDTRVSRISVMRQTQLVIGAGVLAGAALSYFVHPYWVGLAAFFGAGLVFAGATGTCALASLLAAMPWNKLPTSAPAKKSCGHGGCSCG